MQKDYFNYQLNRVDGKGAFVEVLDFSFPINRLVLNFAKYDVNTNKMEFSIPIYLSFGTVFYLSNLIKSGRMGMRAEKQKAEQDQTPLFQDLSGVYAEKLKREKLPFAVPQGADLSKTFQIIPGNKTTFALRAMYKLGRAIPNAHGVKGLIAPQGEVLRSITIPVNAEDITGLFAIAEAAIQGWYCRRYQENPQAWSAPPQQ